MKHLPRSFYLRPALQVARDILDKNIVRRVGNSLFIGKIVEAEAYRADDPASHSFHGQTKRNEVMFDEGGHLYVYFTYGMHFCANIVTGKRGVGEAVLIRAVEPLVGIEMMMKNRFSSTSTDHSLPPPLKSLMNLTNGPAKFCDAFGITLNENGTDLVGKKIFIADPTSAKDFILTNRKPPNTKLNIGRSSRIGIRVGLEKKWRFFVKGNPWVSRKDR